MTSFDEGVRRPPADRADSVRLSFGLNGISRKSTRRRPCASQANARRCGRSARTADGAGHRRLRAAVDVKPRRNLEGRDRYRARVLVGDVVHPGGRGRRRPEASPTSSSATIMMSRPRQPRRHRAGRCGSDAESAGLVLTRHHLHLRQVLDVKDEKAVMPIADIEPVADAQRMMAARRHPISHGYSSPPPTC